VYTQSLKLDVQDSETIRQYRAMALKLQAALSLIGTIVDENLHCETLDSEEKILTIVAKVKNVMEEKYMLERNSEKFEMVKQMVLTLETGDRAPANNESDVHSEKEEGKSEKSDTKNIQNDEKGGGINLIFWIWIQIFLCLCVLAVGLMLLFSPFQYPNIFPS